MSEKTKTFSEATAAVLLVFGAGFLNLALLIILPIFAIIVGIIMIPIYIRKRHLKWLKKIDKEAEERIKKEKEIKKWVSDHYGFTYKDE